MDAGPATIFTRYTRVVTVVVHSCSDLKNLAMLGKSDPYVLVDFPDADAVHGGNTDSDKSGKTSVVQDNMNPKYNEQFVFLLDSDATKFRLSVKDDCVGVDAAMGSAQILLDQEDVSEGVAPLGSQGTVTYSYTVVNVAELRVLAGLDEKAALVDSMQATNAALEEQVAELQGALASSQAALAELEGMLAEDGDADEARAEQLAHALARVTSSEEVAESLGEQLEAATEEIAELNGALSEAQAAAEAYAGEVEAANATMEGLQASLGAEAADGEMAEAAAAAAAATAAALAAEKDAVQAELAEALSAQHAAEERAAAAEQEAADAAGLVEELTAANDALVAEGAAATGAGDEVAATVQGLRAEIEHLQAQLEEASDPTPTPAGEVVFTQASSGGNWLVGVDPEGKLWRRSVNDLHSNGEKLWGTGVQVTTDGENLWHLNATGNIYHGSVTDDYSTIDGQWHQEGTGWSHLSAGGGTLVGVRTDGTVAIRAATREGEWHDLPGALVQASTDGTSIWGVNINNNIYFMDVATAWELGTEAKWTKVGGALKQISVNGGVVWGVNGGGALYKRPSQSPAGSWTMVYDSGFAAAVPTRAGLAGINSGGVFVTMGVRTTGAAADAAVLAEVPRGYMRLWMHMAHRTYKSGALLAVKSAAFNLAVRVEDAAGDRVRAHKGDKLGGMKLINIRPHPRNPDAVLLGCKAPNKPTANYRALPEGRLQVAGATGVHTQFTPQWSAVSPGKLAFSTAHGLVQFAGNGHIDLTGQESSRTDVHVVTHPAQSKDGHW